MVKSKTSLHQSSKQTFFFFFSDNILIEICLWKAIMHAYLSGSYVYAGVKVTERERERERERETERDRERQRDRDRET